MRRYSGLQIATAALVAWAAFLQTNAVASGLAFTPASKFYELKSPALDTAEEISLETWVQADPECPEGSRIFDKWGPASQEGCRLEVGPDHTLRFITTAPEAARAEHKLASDRPSHIIAVFSPRQTIAK